MNRMKASIMALLIAITLFIYVHKPSDHEYLSESPTESTAEVTANMLAPVADLVAPVQPKPKPVIPEQKAAKQAPKPEVKREVKRQVERKPVTETYEVTFYTARCGGCSGITASGHNVKRTTKYNGYTVLSADKSIPFGTVMRITLKDGTVINGIVLDRGGAIRGKRLDVLVASKKEAYRLGRQNVQVEIISEGKR